MERLQITTLTAQDISSPLLVATYTADADRELLVQLYLSGLAGGGAYRACLTKQLGGAGPAYQAPTSAVTLSGGVTTAFLPTLPLPVKDGDVVKVYVQGLAGDTAVAVVTEVFDVLATLATSAAVAALNDITVADIIAGVSEDSLDLQEMLRIILAAAAGKASGGGTTEVAFRDQADTKDRIVMTVDEDGNRTAVTVDGS